MFGLKNIKSLILLISMILINNAVAQEINVVTDRSDFHLRPIFEDFEEQTDIQINAAFIEKGSIYHRTLLRPNEADVIIATDITALAGLSDLEKLVSLEKLANIPSDFVHKDYATLSYRVRGFIVRNDVENPPNTYKDLVSESYKVCIRPLSHPYNISLFSQMIADRGEKQTKKWISSLIDSLETRPRGNDRKQAELVSKGICDVGIMNSYYYQMLKDNPDQAKYAENTHLVFPNQTKQGSYILSSGIAITNDRKIKESMKFVRFLLSKNIQQQISADHYEYPVREDVELTKKVRHLAETLNDGRPNINMVDPKEAVKYREKAIDIIVEQAVQ